MDGVVLPSYIRLGNRQVHDLTVADARDTVLYYLSDPTRGGAPGLLPESTMGQDLEKLLCMLLGVRSLQGMDGRITGQDFMEAVFRTKSQLDQYPFVVMTRRWISQQRSAPMIRVSGNCKEKYAAKKGNIGTRLKAWGSNSGTAAVTFNPQPLWCISTDRANKKNLQETSSPQLMVQDVPFINLVSSGDLFSPGNVPMLPEVSTSEVQLESEMQINDSSGKSELWKDSTAENSPTSPVDLTTTDLKVDNHVTDLLMRTIELAVKNEQLDKCKTAISELVDFCHTLSQLPTVIPKDIVQGFVQQILGHRVTWDDGSEPQVWSEPGLTYPNTNYTMMLSTPGPIRRTSRSATPHCASRCHIPAVFTYGGQRVLGHGE